VYLGRRFSTFLAFTSGFCDSAAGGIMDFGCRVWVYYLMSDPVFLLPFWSKMLDQTRNGRKAERQKGRMILRRQKPFGAAETDFCRP
jgi:hypothetical protein